MGTVFSPSDKILEKDQGFLYKIVFMTYGLTLSI